MKESSSKVYEKLFLSHLSFFSFFFSKKKNANLKEKKSETTNNIKSLLFIVGFRLIRIRSIVPTPWRAASLLKIFTSV